MHHPMHPQPNKQHQPCPIATSPTIPKPGIRLHAIAHHSINVTANQNNKAHHQNGAFITKNFPNTQHTLYIVQRSWPRSSCVAHTEIKNIF